MKIIILRFLLAMRATILGLSKFFSLLFFIGTILIFFDDSFQTTPFAGKIIIVILAMLFSLTNWLYDDLIFYFTPEDFHVTLYH